MSNRSSIPTFHGNISFNAQHSPMGAFMSFTCGHFGTGGGIGVEIGKPASQNVYIGVKHGKRRAIAPIRCLPFIRAAAPTVGAANYDVEHSHGAPASGTPSIDIYRPDQITRQYGWASDRWTTPDFTFTVYSPFAPIPEPGTDAVGLRATILPAVIATLTIDNREGTDPKTGFFGIDFLEAGTRLLDGTSETAATVTSAAPHRLGFAWRRKMGVMGLLEGSTNDDANRLFAFQRWSVAEGIGDVNPQHALGSCGGLGFEVPPGAVRTLVLAIGVYLDGVVTTGLEGRYYYTRFFSGLEEVLVTALERSSELRTHSKRLDAQLLASHLSPDQQFLVAHGTRGYYGSTQLLDVGGEPFWVVNEGEYCMMNTLDLSIDHAFWELAHNPWVVRNILTKFARHYSYHDQVKTRGGAIQPGGLSFCHDMGVNNNFSPSGHSSYELPHLKGCFSHMTQEQLCNWVLLAACYVVKSGDTEWLLENAHLITACADNLRNRANSTTGVMCCDSWRCGTDGQEITTYDSLDESLGQARGNTYIAAKCWATWIGLDMLRQLAASAGGAPVVDDDFTSLADRIASHLIKSAGADGTLPAVLEKDSAGYRSRILPVAEALIYPAYWRACIQQRDDATTSEIDRMLATWLRSDLMDVLRRHSLELLTNTQRSNLFADGGIKLSSTSNNSWMSKIALFQYVARQILRLEQVDASIGPIFSAADSAHVRWQTDGAGYWACSDQFVSGIAKGSRFYPRIITAALWLNETGESIEHEDPLPHADSKTSIR